MRWPWPVALAGSVVTAVLVVGGVVLATLEPTASTFGWAVVGGAAALVCAGLGALVARRVRDNPVGPLLVAVGACVAFSCARQVGFQVLAQHDDTAERLNWLVALTTEASSWLFAAIGLLLVYFPDGRLPGRRWRVVPLLLVLGAAVSPSLRRRQLRSVPGAAAGPAACRSGRRHSPSRSSRSSETWRCSERCSRAWRRSPSSSGAPSPVGKRQLKWLALAGVGVPGFIVVCLGEVALTGEARWPSLVIGIAAIFGIPIAIAIAMLRARPLRRRPRAGHDRRVRAWRPPRCWWCSHGLAGRGACCSGRDSHRRRRRGDRRVRRRCWPRCAAPAATTRGPRASTRCGRRRWPPSPSSSASVQRRRRRARSSWRSRLRAALRDPELRVGYVRPGGRDLVDELGAPAGRRRVGARSSARATTDRRAAASARPLLSNELLRADRRGLRDARRGRAAAARADRGAARGGGEPRPAAARRRRGAPPAGARPARRRAAAAGLARDGAAAGAAAPRRRRRRRRRPARPDGRRARHGGRRAAPDRPRPAPEQPGRRAARGARRR